MTQNKRELEEMKARRAELLEALEKGKEKEKEKAVELILRTRNGE